MKDNVRRITIALLFIAGANGLLAQKSPKNAAPGQKAASAKKALPPVPENLKSKEIISEFPCNGNATIYLENMFRRIEIRTSTDNKVKLVTTVYYQGDLNFTDKDWLKKQQISISGNADNVVVKTGNLKENRPKNAPNLDHPFLLEDGNRASRKSKLVIRNEKSKDDKTDITTDLNSSVLSEPSKSVTLISMAPGEKRKPDMQNSNSIPIFDSAGNWSNRKSSNKRSFILYIPDGAKLQIESQYADINLASNLKELKARISNGALTTMNAERITFIGVYGSFHGQNITDMNAEVRNGSFTAKKIKTLHITSRNSTVELSSVNEINMTSNADDYDIDESESISGEKNYGDLRVTTLKNSVDLTGVNSDIKIRDIEPGVKLIKIKTRYANLRLPVDNLKNYSVNFEGTGGNVYASFQKSNITTTSFKAGVGDQAGNPTQFQLKCDNCTTDFK